MTGPTSRISKHIFWHLAHLLRIILRLYHLNWKGKWSVPHKENINWDCTISTERENDLSHTNEKSTDCIISTERENDLSHTNRKSIESVPSQLKGKIICPTQMKNQLRLYHLNWKGEMICPTQMKNQLRLYHLNWRGKLSVPCKWKINWDWHIFTTD